MDPQSPREMLQQTKAAAERQPQPHDTKLLLFQNDFTTPSFQHTSALLQKQASADDLDYWTNMGLTRVPTGLWTNKEGIIGIPRAAAPLLLSYLHGPGHIGPRPLLKKYQDCFSTRKAHNLVQQLVSSCLTCAQNNVQGPQHGKHGHLPPPLGPLQDLQIDFTHMPRQRGNLKYLCVMVDKFSTCQRQGKLQALQPGV